MLVVVVIGQLIATATGYAFARLDTKKPSPQDPAMQDGPSRRGSTDWIFITSAAH
jgi:hypothetical protein